MDVNIRLNDLKTIKNNYEDKIVAFKDYLSLLDTAINDLNKTIPESLRSQLNNIHSSYNSGIRKIIQDTSDLINLINKNVKKYSNLYEDTMKNIESVLRKMNSCYLVSDVASETVNGYYGSGEKRIKELKKAGYDVYKVQKMINSKYYGGTDDVDNGGLFESNSVKPYNGNISKRMVLESANLGTTPPRTLIEEPVPVAKTNEEYVSKNSSLNIAEEIIQTARTGGISALAKSENRTARVVAGVLTGGASSVIYSDNPTAKTVTAIATGGISVAANSPNPYVRVGTAVATGGTSIFFKR